MKMRMAVQVPLHQGHTGGFPASWGTLFSLVFTFLFASSIGPPKAHRPPLLSNLMALCISFQYHWTTNISSFQGLPGFLPGPYSSLRNNDSYLQTILLLTRELKISIFLNVQIYSTFCDSQIRFLPQQQSSSWEQHSVQWILNVNGKFIGILSDMFLQALNLDRG